MLGIKTAQQESEWKIYKDGRIGSHTQKKKLLN